MSTEMISLESALQIGLSCRTGRRDAHRATTPSTWKTQFRKLGLRKDIEDDLMNLSDPLAIGDAENSEKTNGVVSQ